MQDAELWHARFGHVGYGSLMTLQHHNMVHDLSLLEMPPRHVCEGCVLGKMHRFAFSQDGSVRATRKLQLVHSDVCGPMRTPSVGNSLYFVTFIDVFSRFCWVYPLKAKSDVFAIFQHYVSMVENETGCKVQTLRTDRGGEYMSERKNRSLMEMARCMLKAKSLPHKLWMEAVACATHVLNRCPTRALKTITPYESWYDRKPLVSYLRVFGCLAYAHIPQQLRGKFDDKAVKCIFVGYSSGSFLPSFVENQESQQVDKFDQSFDQHVTPHDVEEIVREEQEVLREERTLPKWVQKTLQDSKLDAPLPQKTRAGTTFDREQVDLACFSTLCDADEPDSFEQALECVQWKDAMQQEIDSIHKNHTWDLVSTPVDTGSKLSIHDAGDPFDVHTYAAAVGCLIYLAGNTCPDIQFGVSQASRFMHSPGMHHLQAVKRILRYLSGTPNLSMFFPTGDMYGKHSSMQLLGYSDSDWAGDFDTRHSTSGNCFFLGNACISWLSKKQPTVATSTCEAEYRAAFTAKVDYVWIRRSQQYLYRNSSQNKPLPPSFLVAWASYSLMHKACFNHSWTEAYLNRESLHDSCRFLVYIEEREGLGNGLLSLASAFAFALATDRVLLIDGRKNIAKLLCEPFPESSWVLPRDFPYQNLQNHSILGPLVANRFNESAASLNLQHNLRGQDEPIFCEETYTALMGVKWVAWKSNQYFVTNFFLVPSFWEHLRPIFGDDVEHIFTYISRVLLLPTNDTWAFILREFWSYLSGAVSRLGVQVRLHGRPNLAEYDRGAYDNVLNCLVENGYLPSSVDADPSSVDADKFTELSSLYNRKMQALRGDVSSNVDVVMLVASLQGKYAETMKDHFGQLSTKGAKMVRVHSVSQLGSENKGFYQAQLAFVEIWLLSFGDKLATSAYSTFGYIAQGMGDIHPLILRLRKNDFNASCVLGHSVEPCNHYPRKPRECLGATAKLSEDHKQWIRAHLRHCQDHTMGWQLAHDGSLSGTPVAFDFL
ncbi:hypothetical protein L7F22_031502 [Adiantum nelumboides]|nr:hypothetical protein [Adiantum nelumboides]